MRIIWQFPLVFIALLLAGQPAPITAATDAQKADALKQPLPPLEKASWIWHNKTNDVCQFRTPFTLDAAPVSADCLITADNGYELYLNGVFLGADMGKGREVWSSVEHYDITKRLVKGRNVLRGSAGRCAARVAGRGRGGSLRIK